MIDYKSMPKSEKYSQFVCAELNNCADTIRDIDGTLYCRGTFQKAERIKTRLQGVFLT